METQIGAVMNGVENAIRDNMRKGKSMPRSDSEMETRPEAGGTFERALKRGGFPKRLREKDIARGELFGPGNSGALTEWETKLRMVQQAVLHDGTTWLFIGPRGRGKTQLATEVARGVVEKKMPADVVHGERVPAKFLRAAELFSLIRSTYHATSEQTEAGLLEEWAGKNAPALLVIDEMNYRKGSDAEEVVLNTIVCKRHDDGRDTILIHGVDTPRLSAAQLDEALQALNASIVSRMQEGGGVVKFDWDSFRTGK